MNSYKKIKTIAIFGLLLAFLAISMAQTAQDIAESVNLTSNNQSNHANLTNLEWSQSNHTLDTDLNFQTDRRYIFGKDNTSFIYFQDYQIIPVGIHYPMIQQYVYDPVGGSEAYSELKCSIPTEKCYGIRDIYSAANNGEIRETIDPFIGDYTLDFGSNIFKINKNTGLSFTNYSGTGNNPLFVDANGLFFRNTSSQTDNTKVNKSGDNMTGVLNVHSNILMGELDDYTELYTGFHNQNPSVMQLGNKFSTGSNTNFSTLIFSNNQSGTNNVVGSIAVGNTAITASEKRLSFISFFTNGAIDKGKMRFFSCNSGTCTEYMIISDAIYYPVLADTKITALCIDANEKMYRSTNASSNYLTC